MKLTVKMAAGILLILLPGCSYAENEQKPDISSSPVVQTSKIKSITELVNLSGLDQISNLSVIQAMFPNAENRDENYSIIYKCVLNLDSTEFNKIYSDALYKKMSNKNISDAISFYKGALGKKFVNRQIVASYLYLDIPTQGKVEELSSEEIVIVETFLDSDAGKFFEMRNILQLPNVLDAVVKNQEVIARRCQKSQ